MQVIHKENENGLSITLEFTSMEVNCLRHDLLGVQGIVDWYAKGPSSEKVYRCKERMEKEMLPRLRAKGMAIPPDDESLHKMIKEDPDYKDREAREKNEKQ